MNKASMSKLALAATLSVFSPGAPLACPEGIDPNAHIPLEMADPNRAVFTPEPGSCHLRASPSGYPLPDPNCTPGALNPTLTIDVLRDPSFTTKCVRNQATTKAEKHIVYSWYGITEPPNNYGPNQTCELDHLVDLGSGGADTLENIWPQCGRSSNSEPFFRLKDEVEVHQQKAVRNGTITVPAAAELIAEDWSQLLPLIGK